MRQSVRVGEPQTVPPRADATAPQPVAAPLVARSRLPLSLHLLYGLPRSAVGLVGLPVAVYLVNFGTDVLLIAPAAMGAIHGLSRLWDGVTDPAVGYWSDCTRARWGRRRTWMLASALPMLLAVIALWSPPSALGATGLVLWMAAGLLLYETAQTAFLIPHGAMGVELTNDYGERTRLFGWQHIFLTGGTFFGFAALAYLQNAEDPRSSAMVFGLVGGIALGAMIAFSAALLPERREYQGRGGVSVVRAFADVFPNKHARLLFVMYGVETLGVGAVASLAIYVATYILKQPELFLVLIGCYLLPQPVLTPLWIALAHRIEKKKLWLGAMALQAACFVAHFFYSEATAGYTIALAGVDVPYIVVGVSFLLAVGAGVGAVCAPSIKADVIDYDEFLTGERKEGSYLAAWNMIRKAASAVTPVLALSCLGWSGYVPNQEQGELSKLVILFFYGLFPALSLIAGMLIFARFGFNRQEHAEVRAAIAARADAQSHSR